MALGLCLFFLAYVLISAPRLRLLALDRPAAALFGALAFVITGIQSPAQAISAVNMETLLLLFGLMGVGAVLKQQGILATASEWALQRFARPQALLGALVWGAGALSALITNDAVCVLGTPLVVSWIKRRHLPAFPFLLALATAANTGSVATLVGNPQNMLCATLGGLQYRSYLAHMLPVAVVALAINHAMIAWLFKEKLRQAEEAAPNPHWQAELPQSDSAWSRRFTFIVLAISVAAYLAGAHLAITAVAAFTALLVIQGNEGHKLWAGIEWTVLVFFSALFVIVDGLVRSGGAAALLSLMPLAIERQALGAVVQTAMMFLAGSNLVSNVPFILVIQPQLETLAAPAFWWELLAMASTFAGNMTLLGSVANIIVAEGGAEVGGLGFWRYFKVGFPLALITTLLGAVWLYALAAS